MDARLDLPFRLLHVALGLMATLAGLDKFFNVLADWGSYVSPLAAQVLPVSVGTFRRRLMKSFVIASFVAGTLLMAAPASAQAPHQAEEASATSTLRQNMRKLWSDHVIWTRQYIVAAVGDQPDTTAAANRLMKNQEDIGGAVAVYYGKPAGDQLTSLLKEHISIAVDIIKFAKAGDKAAQQQADEKWHKNGEAIADFLSKANPNWPRATLVSMMNKHLATTTDEVVARLTKDWEKDVRAFDTVYDHILAMSDALADGIIKQFPAKFGAPKG